MMRCAIALALFAGCFSDDGECGSYLDYLTINIVADTQFNSFAVGRNGSIGDNITDTPIRIDHLVVAYTFQGDVGATENPVPPSSMVVAIYKDGTEVGRADATGFMYYKSGTDDCEVSFSGSAMISSSALGQN